MTRSMTQFFVQWLEKSEAEEDEKLEVLRASQRCLLDALRQVIGEAKSLTYEIERGALITLFPEEEEAFSLEFSEESGNQERVTKLYDYYFPFPSDEEAAVDYQGRLLEGLDTLVDDLARARLIQIDK